MSLDAWTWHSGHAKSLRIVRRLRSVFGILYSNYTFSHSDLVPKPILQRLGTKLMGMLLSAKWVDCRACWPLPGTKPSFVTIKVQFYVPEVLI